MILAHGRIYDPSHQNEILGALEADTNDTLANKTLDVNKLVDAVITVAEKLKNGEYSDIISAVDGAEKYVQKAADLLSEENVRCAVRSGAPEIPDLPGIDTEIYPVGVLFHIAAGNIDVLPAYSVLEGLLCGNVNVLKLPSQDNGITVRILSELIGVMPELADFIYVFDTPSSDLAAMVRMAEAADKIIVWGGDEAVAAVRRFAPPCTDIVVWGHKTGFAYVCEDYASYEEELYGLAKHITATGQLFCSSCQRIFVNTSDRKIAESFCGYFLRLLEKAKEDSANDIGAEAELTLRKLTANIENAINGAEPADKTYYGRGSSVTLYEKPELAVSGFYGNIGVSALPEEELFGLLRGKKGYLQTACLIGCTDKIKELALRAGVCRVMKPEDMSEVFPGEGHDGEYELQRYRRIVNIQR